jgi:hypothetical protein
MESTANAQRAMRSPIHANRTPKPRGFKPFDPAKAGNTLSARDLEKTMKAWSMGKAVHRRMEEKLVSFLGEPLEHGVERWIEILNELTSSAAPGGKGAEQKARIIMQVESAILGYSQILLSSAQVCCRMQDSKGNWGVLRKRQEALMAHNGRLTSEADNVHLRENLQATSDIICSRSRA